MAGSKHLRYSDRLFKVTVQPLKNAFGGVDLLVTLQIFSLTLS